MEHANLLADISSADVHSVPPLATLQASRHAKQAATLATPLQQARKLSELHVHHACWPSVQPRLQASSSSRWPLHLPGPAEASLLATAFDPQLARAGGLQQTASCSMCHH